ncbi:MAG: histidine phosphatase family protein [Pseudomonadota bacterium]|nr:histidine phosphatase family protein [Pseudomonadota bacterium]
MSGLPDQLVLLRHAEALPAAIGQEDFDRGLSPRGVRQAAAVGGWIKQHLDAPDVLLCSPARRTRETLQGVVDAGCALPEPGFEPHIYEASAASLLALLESVCAVRPDAGRVCLIGHNPGLELLIASLSSRLPAGGMATAGLAVLHRDDAASGYRLAAYQAP